jgi:hypothetical protein
VPSVVIVALKPSAHVEIHVESVRQKLSIEATEYIVAWALLLLATLTTLATALLLTLLLLAAALLVLLVPLSPKFVLRIPSKEEALYNPRRNQAYHQYIIYTDTNIRCIQIPTRFFMMRSS